MEQESRAGCILHGCGVLAALAGLCAAAVQDTPGAALLFHVSCLPVLRAFLTE